MEFNETIGNETLVVSGYGNGNFRLGGTKVKGSILLTPKRFYSWDIKEFEDISIDCLKPILETKEGIEIILFGTGPSIQMVPAEIQKYLSEKSIAFDMMDTGAAARTFNVLQMEGRRVGAALIAVE